MQRCKAEQQQQLTINLVEDYPKGYPRFSAFVAAHESFQIFRRFSHVRMRLLLLTQDRISQLEHELDNLDNNEQRPLFLGSSRRDKNVERQATILELREALKSYGASSWVFQQQGYPKTLSSSTDLNDVIFITR